MEAVSAVVAAGSPQLRIDDCLSVRDDHLFVEGCDTVELAERFGTPLYVVSEDQLRRNARRLSAAFSASWPGPVQLLPSIKANNVLALRRILTAEGLGCDTFGLSELEAALACGVPPALISVNGGGKSAALVERAVATGCAVTLDAPRELDLAFEAAEGTGRRARVRVRVRPDLSALGTMPSDFSPEGAAIVEVSRRYKAGIPLNEVLPMGERALRDSRVELTGVHAHLARHTANLDAWASMMQALGQLVGKLSAAWGGWLPTEIDAGGGMPTRRDPTGRAIPRVAAAGGEAPPVERFADVIASSLAESLAGAGVDPNATTLQMEPGRACYADAGIHLSTVTNVKHESDPAPPLTFVELDTSEVFLLDVHLEHNRWQTRVATKMNATPAITADLVGTSCGFDTIVPDASMPEVAPGDVVAFLDTGAYQEVCASNFNAMGRPATVLVTGADARVVRRAETFADVFRRDVTGLGDTRGPEDDG